MYEGWRRGGPNDAVYDVTESGWFDSRTFSLWFFKCFLPHVQDLPGKKLLLGDNLASHFCPAVIEAAEENDIYFTCLPPHATHLMQPLDVSVFGPMKRVWMKVLSEWRTESRRKGCLPKEYFPVLLLRLIKGMASTVGDNLRSGFRACGLVPIDRQNVLRKLPGNLLPLI